jgi:hypothetical protein
MRCWKCLPSSSLQINVRIFNAFITFSNMFGALLISSIFPLIFPPVESILPAVHQHAVPQKMVPKFSVDTLLHLYCLKPAINLKKLILKS